MLCFSRHQPGPSPGISLSTSFRHTCALESIPITAFSAARVLAPSPSSLPIPVQLTATHTMNPARLTQIESPESGGACSSGADPFPLHLPSRPAVSRRWQSPGSLNLDSSSFPRSIRSQSEVYLPRFTPRTGLTQSSSSRTLSPQVYSPTRTPPPPCCCSRDSPFPQYSSLLFPSDIRSLPPSPTSSTSESWFFDSDDEFSDIESCAERDLPMDPPTMQNTHSSNVPNADGRLSLPANFSCAPPVVASQPESSQYEHVSRPAASAFQHQQPSPVFFSVDHIAIPSATNSIVQDSASNLPLFPTFPIAMAPRTAASVQMLSSSVVHPHSPPYTPMGPNDQYAAYTPMTAAQHSAPAIAIPASDSTASLPMDPRAFAALAFPPLIPSTPSSMLVPETTLQDQAVSVLLSPVSGSSSYMPSPAAISAAFPNHGSPSNKPSPPPRSRSASRSSMQYIPILPCSLSPTSSPKELSSNPVRRRHSTTSSSASTSNKPSPADDPIKQARAAAKRQRNTDAARRSRLRRNKRLDELEVRVHELEGRNRELRLRAAVAQADREACQAKEREMKARVAFLEEKMLQVYQSKAAAVQE